MELTTSNDCIADVLPNVLKYSFTKISGLQNDNRVVTEIIPMNDCVFIDVRSPNEIKSNISGDNLRLNKSGSPYQKSIDTFTDSESRNDDGHFLEYLAFKGTKNRTGVELEMEAQNIGEHLNAYTSREQTVYSAQILKEDLEGGVVILADILQNSLFDNNAIERERRVILQEMENVYNDTKEELIFDHLHENCFQDCGLGKTILGPTENIKRINRDNLLEYINTYYTGDNMVIAASGVIDDHDKLVQLIRDNFGNIKDTSNNRPRKDESYFREIWDYIDFINVLLSFLYVIGVVMGFALCKMNLSSTQILLVFFLFNKQLLVLASDKDSNDSFGDRLYSDDHRTSPSEESQNNSHNEYNNNYDYGDEYKEEYQDENEKSERKYPFYCNTNQNKKKKIKKKKKKEDKKQKNDKKREANPVNLEQKIKQNKLKKFKPMQKKIVLLDTENTQKLRLTCPKMQIKYVESLIAQKNELFTNQLAENFQINSNRIILYQKAECYETKNNSHVFGHLNVDKSERNAILKSTTKTILNIQVQIQKEMTAVTPLKKVLLKKIVNKTYNNSTKNLNRNSLKYYTTSTTIGING